MTSPRTVYPEMSGRVAVITGGARGLGEAHAEALLRNGVHVVVGDLDFEALQATAERLCARHETQASIVPTRMDVSVLEDHAAAADLAMQRFGRLDYWVNNAGIYPQGEMREITPERFKGTMNVNVDGTLFGMQVAAEVMEGRGGSIVNMASIAAFTFRRGSGAYAVSKAAVDHLTRVLAVELGPEGIRVNAIAPGVIDTRMAAWVYDSPDILETTLETIPLRRLGTPADVADAMLFLLSDAAAFITGHTLVVDGGGRHR